jgi:hypothetical protein
LLKGLPRPLGVQGKRHQQNLAKRAAREAAEKQAAPAPNRRVQVGWQLQGVLVLVLRAQPCQLSPALPLPWSHG